MRRRSSFIHIVFCMAAGVLLTGCGLSREDGYAGEDLRRHFMSLLSGRGKRRIPEINNRLSVHASSVLNSAIMSALLLTISGGLIK